MTTNNNNNNNNNNDTNTTSVGPPANATTTTIHHQTNKNAALAARIKRVMQSDEEVGKIVKTTPLVVAKALELFLTKLFKATADMALAHGARIIGPTHLKGAIQDNDEFDFLEDVVKDVPDLPPPPDPAMLAAKLLERVDEDGNPKKRPKWDWSLPAVVSYRPSSPQPRLLRRVLVYVRTARKYRKNGGFGGDRRGSFLVGSQLCNGRP